MNRYSGGPSILKASAFLAPLVPLVILSATYDSTPYQIGLIQVFVVWLVGLGISYGLIAIHEVGHLIAAHLAGIQIANVTIGHWRRLFSFSLGGIEVIVRAAPASGYVMPKQFWEQHSAPRTVLFLLGGVIAQGALIGVIAFTPSPQNIDSFGDLIKAFTHINIIWIGGYQVLLNLFPSNGWVAGELHPTDGLQLFQLWKNRGNRSAQLQTISDLQEIDNLRKNHKTLEALKKARDLVSRHPENSALVHFVGALHSECGQPSEAETIWRGLLKNPLNPPSRLAEVLDSLSCLALYYGRTDLLQEADAWTVEALRLAPHAITLKGTRGGVLVELGQIDEGIDMLTSVVKQSECSLDQAISSAYLAKGCAAKGKCSEANRWMDRANAIRPDHVVILRIQNELSAAGILTKQPLVPPS